MASRLAAAGQQVPRRQLAWQARMALPEASPASARCFPSLGAVVALVATSPPVRAVLPFQVAAAVDLTEVMHEGNTAAAMVAPAVVVPSVQPVAGGARAQAAVVWPVPAPVTVAAEAAEVAVMAVQAAVAAVAPGALAFLFWSIKFMQYAYFDPITRQVIGWFDTDAFDCVLPDAELMIELSQAEWEANAHSSRWVTSNLSLSASPPVLRDGLEQIKTAKLAEIRAACAAEIVGGFTSFALGSLHIYPSQPSDQSNLLAAVLSSLSAPVQDWETPVWCVDDQGLGAYRMHTAAQVQAVGNDSLSARNAALANKAALESRITQALLVEQIETSSWPIKKAFSLPI